MPLYDFECARCSHTEEHFAGIEELTLPCSECGGNMKRLITSNHYVVGDVDFVTDNITGDPIRVDSRRKLRDLERKHGIVQKIGKGWW